MDVNSWKLINPDRKDERRYLSVSSVNLYEQCPMSWRLQYIDQIGRAVPATPAMTMGTLVHQCLADINDYWAANGKYPDPDKTSKIVERVFDKERSMTPAENVKNRLLAKQLVHTYLSKTAQRFHPCIVEGAFLFEHVSKPTRVFGFFDLTTPDGIWDYKVTGQPLSKDNNYDLQITTYAQAYRLITGSWPRHFGIINLVKSTNKIQIIEWEIDTEKIQKALDKFSCIYDNVQRGEFPARPGPQCKYCPFAGTACPEGMAELKGSNDE